MLAVVLADVEDGVTVPHLVFPISPVMLLPENRDRLVEFLSRHLAAYWEQREVPTFYGAPLVGMEH